MPRNISRGIGRWLQLIAAFAVTAAPPASAQVDSWQRQPAPVLQPAAAGAWDDVLTYAPRLLKRTDGTPYVDADGRYYLFYTGSGRATVPRDETGLARSRTLLTWERASSRPVLPLGAEGTYDQGDASGVTILEENGLFHMWYEGNGRVVTSDFVTINYATSRDGVTWN
jgi:beta-xylosidase